MSPLVHLTETLPIIQKQLRGLIRAANHFSAERRHRILRQSDEAESGEGRYESGEGSHSTKADVLAQHIPRTLTLGHGALA